MWHFKVDGVVVGEPQENVWDVLHEQHDAWLELVKTHPGVTDESTVETFEGGPGQPGAFMETVIDLGNGETTTFRVEEA